ncbi:Nn.00g111270.m01.CDS01 [Neocucurbitaria sp. VM-36]
MPLHLLGKKSWNVYNADNIARVKADEAAAAAREAAAEQRMQELDAERRLAILRGRTPPPLPAEDADKGAGRKRDKDRETRGHDRKRRKLAGEDDTAMEIRLAASMTASKEDRDETTSILKLRSTASDAPLTNHAGNIDLFPVDMKEAIKREKNAEAEKEKKKKERALEDQYTMRFSNAAGFKTGLSQPWYTTGQKPSIELEAGKDVAAYEGLENKNVWGNEDPRRKEREIARISSNDPFAFMQKAQAQLKRSKEDKRKWAEERDRELRELRATQEREDRRSRHRKRKKRGEDDVEDFRTADMERGCDRDSSKHRHRRRRSRSRSKERHGHRTDERADKHADDQRSSRHSQHDRKSRHPRSPDRADQERDTIRKY